MQDPDETTADQLPLTGGTTEKKRKRLLRKQRSFDTSVEPGEKGPHLEASSLPFGHQRGATLRGRKLAARTPYKIGVRFKRGTAMCVASEKEGTENEPVLDTALLRDSCVEFIKMEENAESKETGFDSEELGIADSKIPERVVIDDNIAETEFSNLEYTETNSVQKVKIPEGQDTSLKERFTEEEEIELDNKDVNSKSYTDIIALIETSYKEVQSNEHHACEAPGLTYKDVQMSASKFFNRPNSKKSTDSDRSADSETRLLDSPQRTRRTSNGTALPSRLSISSSFQSDISETTAKPRPWHRLYASGDTWKTKLSSGLSTSSEDIASDDLALDYVPPNRYIAVKLSPETDV